MKLAPGGLDCGMELAAQTALRFGRLDRDRAR